MPYEEKQKALQAHKRMVITVVVVVIAMILFSVLACVVTCMVFTGIIRIIICLAVIFAAMIGVIIFAIFSRRLFSDWNNAYDKVSHGFDGLTEEEINRLKPQKAEKKVKSYYQIRSAIYTISYLVVLGIDIFIVVMFEIPVDSALFIISLFVITGIWFILESDCQAEVHRISSGYYKKGFGYECSQCRYELTIQFQHVPIYDSYPRNKDGVRMVCCPRCNNIVPLYNFDMYVKDYNKYWARVNK